MIIVEKKKGAMHAGNRIGYITHNGAWHMVARAADRSQAKKAVEAGRAAGLTNREQAVVALSFLKKHQTLTKA